MYSMMVSRWSLRYCNSCSPPAAWTLPLRCGVPDSSSVMVTPFCWMVRRRSRTCMGDSFCVDMVSVLVVF